MDKNKIIAQSAFIGVVSMNFGIGLAINTQVAVAPPVVVLPLTVVNMSWALVFFFMLKHDIRFGYIGAILVGISMVLLPILVFMETLGPAPAIVPAHYVGVSTDIILGIILVITGIRGRLGNHKST
jgi:hypothetical protein